MSEEAVTDEVVVALRELAATHATPPVVGGAEIRQRATRRGRRRRAAVTLGAGTTVLALLGFALTLRLGGDQDGTAGRQNPAATPSASAVPSTATSGPVSGALDASRQTLTFDGRVMPILTDFEALLVSTSPLTVVAKQDERELTVDVVPKGRTVVNVPYAVELRDGEDQPLHVGAFTAQLKALGDYDVQGAVMGLAADDAKWLYARVRVGDTLSVRVDTRPAAEPSDAVMAPTATTSPSDGARMRSAPTRRDDAALS